MTLWNYMFQNSKFTSTKNLIISWSVNGLLLGNWFFMKNSCTVSGPKEKKNFTVEYYHPRSLAIMSEEISPKPIFVDFDLMSSHQWVVFGRDKCGSLQAHKHLGAKQSLSSTLASAAKYHCGLKIISFCSTKRKRGDTECNFFLLQIVACMYECLLTLGSARGLRSLALSLEYIFCEIIWR